MEQSEVTQSAVEQVGHRRLGLWLLLPLLGTLVVLFILSAEWRRSLTIERIVVDGARMIPLREIVAQARVELKSRWCEADLFEVQQHIAGMPFIRSVLVNREYPDALNLRIVEREPIAAINNGLMWYVDNEGVLLPYNQSGVKLDLPVISGVSAMQNAHPGQTASDKDIFLAIEILQQAHAIDSSLYHFISEVNMNHGNDITLYSIDVGVPVLIGRGDVARKLVMLQTFWNTFVNTNNAGQLQYVDLRFEDQVVVKWHQQTENPSAKASL